MSKLQHMLRFCYHPTCANMSLYYMAKYEWSTIKFQYKQCTEQNGRAVSSAATSAATFLQENDNHHYYS